MSKVEVTSNDWPRCKGAAAEEVEEIEVAEEAVEQEAEVVETEVVETEVVEEGEAEDVIEIDFNFFIKHKT